jgi:hypothetical protein
VKTPVFFNGIVFDIPYHQIFGRLGYNNYLTEIEPKQKSLIDNIINIGISNCSVGGSYIKCEIIINQNNIVELDNGIKWHSRDISLFLNNSSAIYLLGVTAGSQIVNLRDSFLEKGDNFTSVIIDAVGSEMAERGIEWLHEFLLKKDKIDIKNLTKRRYSPGYGDLLLSSQKEICLLLQMNKIGVALNENFILFPEKSVTAIIGIS